MCSTCVSYRETESVTENLLTPVIPLIQLACVGEEQMVRCRCTYGHAATRKAFDRKGRNYSAELG